MIAILGKGFISCLISSDNQKSAIIKLSENTGIYFIGCFMKHVTALKQWQRKVVIWGTLIP